METTDTWGISSAEFLRWYLLAAFLAVALVLLSNWLASHRSVPASPTGRVLTPPEVGALTNDTQAVMASLAMLRGADAIDSQGRVRRTLTDTERTHMDWFTRTVIERLGSGKAPLVRSRLVSNMSGSCAQLRSQLVTEGLLHGRSERGASTVRVFPILFADAAASHSETRNSDAFASRTTTSLPARVRRSPRTGRHERACRLHFSERALC
ncbi:MAG: TIGR04222 domain-containing membrane protein [Rhodococcus sp. (in: high G+C Gram-positive bacteria)]